MNIVLLLGIIGKKQYPLVPSLTFLNFQLSIIFLFKVIVA